VTRFLRILRATIAILSFLLCLLVAIVWIRSYFVSDYFLTYETTDLDDSAARTGLSIATGSGGFGLTKIFWTVPESPFPLNPVWSSQRSTDDPHYPATTRGNSPTLGFHLDRFVGSHGPRNYSTTVIILPFWFLFLIFLLPALPWLIHLRRRFRRRKTGHCPICGYDLRASPHRCPECGHSLNESTSIGCAGSKAPG